MHRHIKAIKWNGLHRSFGVVAAIVALVVAFVPVAYAAQITSRSVTIGSPVASATTTYVFNFTVPSGSVLQSASFTACTTASGACTMPPGFSASGSSLTSQPTNLGDAAGWTVDTGTVGSLRLKKTGNVAAPTSSQTVSFSGVVNPSATNATFFIRIATFTGDDWVTGPVDNGTVATSTAGQVTVTASVDETLTFTLANQTVPLGTLTTSTTGSGTSTMNAATNATSGYSITVSGNTLTAGANTITALASPTASAVNNKQFGINLVANATPAVGTNPSGGTGVAAAGYSVADLFKFVSGNTVASSTGPTNTTTFTTSYIANIDGSTPPGSYQTVLNYVATANF